MHYKRLFNRARPSQLCPALMPPIEPPGHASFPSGHATEGYLLSLCLRKVLPEVLRTPADPANPTNQTDPEDESTPLLRLARRVARNREVMGLHYRSDTRAGRILAEKTAPLLLGLSCVVEIVEKACEEWTVPSPKR